MKNQRIYLSPPNVSNAELHEVEKVIDSGWVAPVGDAIDEFESQLAAHFPGKSVLAVNSGTSALHLALILAGIEDGDEVLVSSFTFAACANVILYERAIPVFIDSENHSWNLDPNLLEIYLESASSLPKAIIVTHLFGMPADIVRIVDIAKRYGVKVIEDAAEALGSSTNGQQVGGLADYGILSFNGNKIITTSGGGALICGKEDWERGKYLSSQANSGNFAYDHKEAGYNYRLSNVLAGIGLGQLPKLKDFVERKRNIYMRYKKELNPHFTFLCEPNGYFSNRWLTTAIMNDQTKSITELISFLDKNGVESRRLWKPLHMHEAYKEGIFIGEGACEEIFKNGICLPSGSGLTMDQQSRVIDKIKEWFS